MAGPSPSEQNAVAADPGVVSLRDVRFGYEPGRPVVERVSAGLPAGRLCALIGPNAAGKSTLLRLMLGHFTPWAGAIDLAGRPVSAVAPRRRAALVSYVPQRSGGSFMFTVRQIVTMGRYAHGPEPVGAEAADRAIRCFDLTELADRAFAHLSAGQQQRVLLARAIAQSSGGGQAMLLDEPASSMDLWHVHHTMGVLRRLAGSGLAILIVLHDLNLAAAYVDDVWLMDRGRLAACGPWQDVLQASVLEPVYRVSLKMLAAPGQGLSADKARPVFIVEPAEGAPPHP